MTEDDTMATCPVDHCTHQMPADAYIAWELHRIRHDMVLLRELLEARG